MNEFKMWLNAMDKYKLSGGSQGQCYKYNGIIYKIFHYFIDEYNEFDDDNLSYTSEELLRFSYIVNTTYVWPEDVIMVQDLVVGYFYKFALGRPLYEVDPLNVGLDKFGDRLSRVFGDVRILSDNGVMTYDVTYNILYGVSGFKVIDTLGYVYSELDSVELYRINVYKFNKGVKEFLMGDYFGKFITDNKKLKEMYYDRETNLCEFLKEFRRELSMNEGHEISKLGEATKCIGRVRKLV